MPAKTKIEWADYISNPIKARELKTGKQGHACVKHSEGCTHCWASNFNIRLGTGLGYTQPNLARVEHYIDEKEFKRIVNFKPHGPFKHGRERAVVFSCDMTDIFGSWISDEWLNRLFFAMHMTPHVDWFVLTKRTDRMMNYLSEKHNRGKVVISNIYLGCSVENQKRADERRGAMDAIAYMGWKTLASFEPALEAVNWEGWQFLKGLICGGESGISARPMPPEAPREARNFCAEFDIPFFFKQWGEWIPLDHLPWVTGETTFKHKPVEVNGTMMVKVGKGLAGHVLDGYEHLRMAE